MEKKYTLAEMIAYCFPRKDIKKESNLDLIARIKQLSETEKQNDIAALRAIIRKRAALN